jgi:hypothetical protein
LQRQQTCIEQIIAHL